MNMNVLEACRDVSGGYKMDVGRGSASRHTDCRRTADFSRHDMTQRVGRDISSDGSKASERNVVSDMTECLTNRPCLRTLI